MIAPLAAEFRANPKGPHSPALQRLLNRMRGLPVAGKHILIYDKRSRRYWLAQLTGGRGCSVVRNDDVSFATTAEAEWHVFRLRWQRLYGAVLDP